MVVLGEIKSWESAIKPFKDKWYYLFVQLILVIPLFLTYLYSDIQVYLALFIGTATALLALLTSIFNRNERMNSIFGTSFLLSALLLIWMTFIIIFDPISSLILIGFFQLLIIIISVLLYLLNRKADVLKITGPAPVSPPLIKDIRKHIIRTFKEEKIPYRNYKSKMVIPYGSNEFHVIINGYTLQKQRIAKYSVVMRAKGRMKDPNQRYLEELIDGAISKLDEDKPIDRYPRPIRIKCPRSHNRVIYKPLADNYYCMKCNKNYSEDQLDIEWSG